MPAVCLSGADAALAVAQVGWQVLAVLVALEARIVDRVGAAQPVRTRLADPQQHAARVSSGSTSRDSQRSGLHLLLLGDVANGVTERALCELLDLVVDLAADALVQNALHGPHKLGRILDHGNQLRGMGGWQQSNTRHLHQRIDLLAVEVVSQGLCGSQSRSSTIRIPARTRRRPPGSHGSCTYPPDVRA